MIDRPHVSLKTAAIKKLVENSMSDFDALHPIYVELLFRKRKEARELRKALCEQLAQVHEYFRWPGTDASEGPGGTKLSNFLYAKGLLGYVGYRVGAKGVSYQKRHELLAHVLTQGLPKLNSAEYMIEWGKPNTMKRLKKLANSIASFVRTAKRNGALRMATAIAQWKSDLSHLKRKYYDGKYSFPWPNTRSN